MTGPRAAAIVVCFFIALLSKEQGILFPLMLAILAFVRVPRAAVSPRERACNRWLAVSLIWFESAYFFFREHILKFEWNRQWISWAANPLIRMPGPTDGSCPWCSWDAMWRCWPRHTSCRWITAAASSVRACAITSHIFTWRRRRTWVARGAGCIDSSRRLRQPGRAGGQRSIGARLAGLAVFALLGVALTFGMVSNLPALIGTIFGERLAFMPSAFLAVLAGLVVAALADGTRRWAKALVLALVAAGWSAP